ncbi:unnamed protein product, partial [Rotaria sp. Silwood2]
MNEITIGWMKTSSGKHQYASNIQHFQQHPNQKLKSQEKKSMKKNVRFNCRTSTAKQQAFENTEPNLSGTARFQRLIFDDHEHISSITDSFAT